MLKIETNLKQLLAIRKALIGYYPPTCLSAAFFSEKIGWDYHTLRSLLWYPDENAERAKKVLFSIVNLLFHKKCLMNFFQRGLNRRLHFLKRSFFSNKCNFFRIGTVLGLRRKIIRFQLIFLGNQAPASPNKWDRFFTMRFCFGNV